jgi:hypothetical protein
MIRSLAGAILSADLTNTTGDSVRTVYTQATRRSLGSGNWFQNAVAKNTRARHQRLPRGGLTDERWWTWTREYVIEDVGSIDVLLVSENGAWRSSDETLLQPGGSAERLGSAPRLRRPPA